MSKHEKQVMVLAMAAVAVLAGGTQAWASPIYFDNPVGAGYWDWECSTNVLDPATYLDITLAAADQPGVSGDTVIHQVWINDEKSRVQGGGADPDAFKIEAAGPYDFFALDVGAGTLIPSGAIFQVYAYIAWPGYEFYLPEGSPAYLGVQFPIDGETHYGWVGVIRTGIELDAFAWGYETEAGVPIAAGAPEPGTLALLAMGAIAALRRR